MQQDHSSDIFNELKFDATSRQYIRSMAVWAIIMVAVAVIGYIVSVFEVLITPVKTGGRMEGFDTGLGFGNIEIVFTIASVVIGLVIYFFLFSFARQARNGVDSLNQEQLSKSFGHLKTYFAISSVFILIGILAILLVLVIIGAGK